MNVFDLFHQSDPSSVPQLAWQFVPVQRTVNPVLAFSKGDTVHFLLVKKEETGTIHVIKQRQLHISCDIISLCVSHATHSGTPDCTLQGLIINMFRSYHDDIKSTFNIFCQRSIMTILVLSQLLLFLEACPQDLQYLCGNTVSIFPQADFCGQALMWNKTPLTKFIHFMWLLHSTKVNRNCTKYFATYSTIVDIHFAKALGGVDVCPGADRATNNSLCCLDLVPVLVDYCLLLKRLDLLFDQLYPRLVENMVAKGVFLESLESHIIADRLGHLPTPIMKDLLTHYQSSGMMDSLERCIVHLDITSLDIQQVVQVCWENQLYDAVIYVFNRGMNDYTTPMEKLFTVIIPPLREGRSLRDEEVVMGNKLLVYISCCLAGRAYPLGDIPEDLVVQVKHQVCRCSYTSVLLELLQVGSVVQFNEERLLMLAEKAKFYQICEFLYEKKHLYDRIIDCYLRDPLRKGEIFSYIHNLLSMPGYSPEEKKSVKDKVRRHMHELVTFDPTKSADLVMIHFAEEVQQIISELQDDRLVFRFLSCLLEQQEGHHSDPVLLLAPELYELQLDLLSRFDPKRLLFFLQSSQQYRLEEAVLITQKYHHNKATAFLLEKKGDVEGAFDVLLETLKENLSLLAAQREGDDEEETLTNVKDSLNDIIALCHQSSHSLNQQQREVLWFPLLEAMMAAQKQVKGLDNNQTFEALKELTMKVLNCMSSFISLPSIIQRILQDPVYGKGKLGEIQGLILGMLDTFNYEQTLLETTTSLLNHDLHWSLAHLRAAVTRGLHPRQDCCNICLQQYKRRQDAAEEIIVFSCGHLYHLKCLQQKDSGCGFTSDVQQQWSCYKCSSNKGGRAASAEARGRSMSLAQTCVTSAPHDGAAEAARKKGFVEVTLDHQQEQSWDQLRCLYRGPSRLAILSELSHSHTNEKTGLLIGSQAGTSHFQLKLAPPPVFEE
uniref:VPS8 subunit of CORVET complex n=1 Tax=Tetraodon nigroviridis TaxID=99883 RepID=H3CIS9_TETNG